MPTNEEEPIPQSTGLERFAIRSRDVMTGGRMPLGLIGLFILNITCTAVGPVPFNLIGVAASVLIVIDTATHRR